MCVYVCMYVCMYTCVYTHIYACIGGTQGPFFFWGAAPTHQSLVLLLLSVNYYQSTLSITIIILLWSVNAWYDYYYQSTMISQHLVLLLLSIHAPDIHVTNTYRQVLIYLHVTTTYIHVPNTYRHVTSTHISTLANHSTAIRTRKNVFSILYIEYVL